jgi:hypothetical protein
VEADLLLLSDADVRVPLDYVARATRPFKDGEVGLVTGPYRSVPAGSLASRLDALVTNTHFMPSVCVSARFEGVQFGLGASIAVRAEARARACGPGTASARERPRPVAVALRSEARFAARAGTTTRACVKGAFSGKVGTGFPSENATNERSWSAFSFR